MDDSSESLTDVVAAETAAAGALAYSDDEDLPPLGSARPDERGSWWRPTGLAVVILAGAGVLAATIYFVGQPVPPAAPVAVAPETVTMLPPAPPPPPTTTEPPPPTPPTVTVTAEPPAPTPASAPVAVVPQFNPTPAQDAALINMLRNDGWAIWDPSIITRQAHFACKLFRQGEAPEYVNSRLANESGMGMGPALQLTATAMIVYPDCRRPA